jgi:hypothetical protein
MTLWAPDSAGLVFEHHFGTDAPSSLLNHVTGTTVATLIGAPTYGAGYMDINGNGATPKGIDYGFAVTQDVATIIAVVDPNTGVGLVSSSGTNPALAATGRLWFDANPAPGDSLTLNGQAITFVSSGATGFQVDLGATPQATAYQVGALINANPGVFAVSAFCPIGNSVIELTALAAGTAGNGIGVVTSSPSVRICAASSFSIVSTLSGGNDGEGIVTGIVQSSTNLTGRNSSFGAGGLASVPVPGASGFHYICTRIRAHDFPSISVSGAGAVLDQGVGTTSGRSPNRSVHLLSGTTASLGTGNAKIAYAALFDGRLLTEAEDLALYLAVQSAAALAGVTVN